jgi:SPFH domain / Band 7 family
VPADQQGEDDLNRDARAAEHARRPHPAGPPETQRASAAGSHGPSTRRTDGRQDPPEPAARRRRPPRHLALPAGPPLIAPASGPGHEHPNDARGSLLATVGFGAHLRSPRPEEFWRPVAAFAGFCAVLLLAAFGLASRHVGHVTTSTHTVLTLAALLALVVLLYIVLLALATNDTGRTLALGAGGLAALLSTVSVLFGARAGIALSIAFLVIVVMGGRQSLHRVEPGTLVVTSLPSGRHRTLSPGLSILTPGERVVATLSTQPSTYQTLPVQVRDPSGLAAEAALKVQYALIPGQAASAIAATRDWERPLRKRVNAILYEEVAAFLSDSATAAGALAEGAVALVALPNAPDSPPTGAARELRARIAGRLRRDALRQGIQVLAVELGPVALSEAVWSAWPDAPGEPSTPSRRVDLVDQPPGDTVEPPPIPDTIGPVPVVVPALASAPAGPIPQPDPASPAPKATAQAYMGAMQQRLGEMVEGWRRLLSGQPSPDAETGAPQAVTAPSPNTSQPDATHRASSPREPGEYALSARTLEAMYEAIAEQRVTDPETIRHVADALSSYEPPPDDQTTSDFDPHDAAKELRRLLAGQAAPAETEPTATSSVSTSGGNTPTPPRHGTAPDDDNILRGG